MITAMERLGDGRALVIGDRLDTDGEAAARAHVDFALVLTGGASQSEVDALPKDRPKPVAVKETLAELVAAGP